MLASSFRNPGYSCSDSTFELVKREHTIIAHRKSDDSLFTFDSGQLEEKAPHLRWMPITPVFSRYTLIVCSFSLLVGIVVAIVDVSITRVTNVNVALLISYAIFNIVAHETAHVLALSHCHRKPGRIGIKLNYGLFPAVYVRLNSMMILAPSDQFIIHIAGLLINYLILVLSAFLNCWFIHSADFTTAITYMMYATLCNSAPILNSDGQKALFAAFGLIKPKSFRKAPLIVRLCNVASWIIVGISGAMLLTQLWRALS